MGLIDFSAFDRLSEKEIMGEIKILGKRGYSFDYHQKTGPVFIYGGDKAIFTSPPQSPQIIMNYLAAAKYNLSQISLPAQDVVDFFQNHEEENSITRMRRTGVQLTRLDLENLLDLICLGVSLDKKIFEEYLQETYKDSIKSIPYLPLRSGLRRCPLETTPPSLMIL